MFRLCDINTISVIITVKLKSNEMKTCILLWQDNQPLIPFVWRIFKSLLLAAAPCPHQKKKITRELLSVQSDAYL